MELFDNVNYTDKVFAKPFIKWAGGKTQLLPVFQNFYPKELKLGIIENYFEPFLGGASVFFDVVQKYGIKNSYLSDNNFDIFLIYKVIQRNVDVLIDELSQLKRKYLKLTETKREEFYYQLRENYNVDKAKIKTKKFEDNWITRAGQMIFLNKTCFNGLYRLNKSGDFNVPFGKYTNPGIYDESNLRNVAEILQSSNIVYGDFEYLQNKVNEKSFVYFDPPYRPISSTSTFNSYSKDGFNDNDQRRLAACFKGLSFKGAKLMLSNSDPKNHNEKDEFFDDLYKGFNINRIDATRMINSNSEKRGKIKELLITNY
ncbi:MAG: DNA adenine methylase [Ignavibacteria bacterium]